MPAVWRAYVSWTEKGSPKDAYSDCAFGPGKKINFNPMTHAIQDVPEEIYDIELEHSLLEANAKLAKENRALLDEHGVTAFDFMGAIGSGKTTVIARLVERLKDKFGIAVFNGDATVANDTEPI